MKPLKLSCVPMIYFKAIALDHTMRHEDWLEIAATLGLNAVEVQHRLLESYDGAYLAEQRRMLDRFGLAVSQLTGSGDFVHPDPEVRNREVELLLRQIEAAAELGARSIRITAGQRHPGVERDQAIANFRACLDKAFPLAERHGIWLAYENHYKDYFWNIVDYSFQSEDFLAIFAALRDTPLRVNFDCANQIMAGEDPVPVLEAVKDRVVHTHANDRATRGQYPHSVVGEGVTPLRQLFATMLDAGFDGYVSLEYNGDRGLEGVKQSLEAIRRIWREAQTPEAVASPA